MVIVSTVDYLRVVTFVARFLIDPDKNYDALIALMSILWYRIRQLSKVLGVVLRLFKLLWLQ